MAPLAGGPFTSSIAQRLPSNIIFEILQYFSAPLLTEHLGQFPWYIGHICSSWRIEFLSMQRNFWSQITILLWESHQKAQEEQARILDVLSMFLECNLGYPFSFELDVDDSARKSPYFPQIFNALISESSRWWRVTLKLDIDDIPAQLCHVQGKLERLESLQLSLQEDITDTDYTIPEAFTNLFMSAPYLKCMTIHPLSTWNFNWSIVTVLHIELAQCEEMARLPLVLSQAKRIETLSIHSDASLPSHELITLPNLTGLETDCLSLLQIIITPSLKRLHVDFKQEVEDEPHPTAVGVMKPFLSGSQCRIQTLALGALDAASAIGILSHTPNIEVLHLGTIYSITNIFGWLNEMHRVKTPKLTRLQSLIIYDSWHPLESSKLDNILDFVAWRKTRIEDAGSVVEKLQKFDFRSDWRHDSEGDEVQMDEVQVQLRKSCELYGIQFSLNSHEPETMKDCHDRSSDPYVYSFFQWEEDERSDEEDERSDGEDEQLHGDEE